MGVIQAQQLLALNVNNEQVLKQLDATNDRFRVGEITRTDVAQAEAALAGATASRQTAEGNLQTARGQYQKVVGFQAPANLVEPQPLNLPVKSEQDVAALAREQPERDHGAVHRCRRKRCDRPGLLRAAASGQPAGPGVPAEQHLRSRATTSNGYLVTANLSMPIYQGGSEYAAVRQARQSEQQSHKLVDEAAGPPCRPRSPPGTR